MPYMIPDFSAQVLSFRLLDLCSDELDLLFG